MEEKPTSISRRDAIKALLATGGALAASTLIPGKWSKPVVQTGYVPAHAQGTLPPLTVSVVEACRDLFTCELSYNDPAGLVTNSAQVTMYVLPCDKVIYEGTLGGLNPAGDGYSGSFGTEFSANCAPNSLNTLCVQLFAGSRYADDCGPMTDCD